MNSNLSSIARTTCPAIGRRGKKQAFPILSQMSGKFLSTFASSVYSERYFSGAGNIYDEVAIYS